MGTGYANPASLPQLFSAMADMPCHHLFAGGTDLLVRKGKGMIKLENIINLLKVSEMQGIVETPDMLNVGALATHAEIAAHPAINKTAQALASAADNVGSLQIRNLGTIGGNLCNASPAADTATPLLVLDAVVVAASSGSPVTERRIPMNAFFTGPGKTSLLPGEVVCRILIPTTCPGKSAGSAFIKLARRNALAISVVNGSARVGIEGGRDPHITQARVALGAVAPTPLRLLEVEDWLKGRPLTQEVFAEAGERAAALIAPISDIRSTAEYRRQTASVLVTRLLTEAAAKAREVCPA